MVKKFTKAIFITAHFRERDEFGGQRSRIMYEACKKNYSEISVILPDVDPLNGKKISKKNIKDLNYISVPTYKRKNLLSRMWFQLIYAWKLFFLKTDKNHIHILNNNPLLSYLIFGLKCVFLKRQYILDQRDIPIDLIKKSKISYLFTPIFFIDNLIRDNRLGSISVSEGIKYNCSNHKKKNDAVIELGMDTNFFSSKPKSFKLKNCNIVYIGTINNYFDLENILDLLKENAFSGSFFYYGQPNFEYEKKYNFFINKGKLQKKELNMHLENYDLGIFPIKGNSIDSYLLGNKIFDYLSAGLVIGVTGSGQRDSLDLANYCGVGLDFSRVNNIFEESLAFTPNIQNISKYTNRSIRLKLEGYFSKL